MDFKGYFRKKAIALKRNFYTVPFVLNIIALVIFTCAIFIHSQVASCVIYKEPNEIMSQLNSLNALFLFVITLFSILSVVAYIRYMGRIKNYFMFVLYYILSISQIVLEALFLFGVQNQIKIETVGSTNYKLEQNSIFLIYLHFVFLGIAIIVSSLAPFIQKKLKTIKFSRMSEGESIEVKADSADTTK